MKIKTIFSTLILGAAIAFQAAAQEDAAPKYIFYFIGDGMGVNEVLNAQLYNSRVLDKGNLSMTKLPVGSLATSHSASSDVTDSAAAGTALATGHKTVNGMLGVTPDTVSVTSIAKVLFDDGYGVGLVTSVAIDDATPGAFYAHVPKRSMYREIGSQLAGSGYQFAAGSGLRGTKDKQGRDNGLLKEFAENGVSVSYGLDGADFTADRLLILSPDTARNWNIGYTIDSIPGALTLQGLTKACISHLERVSPDKFFIMVEGGNIDHSGHSNDAATNIIETINFDRTLDIALDFYREHPDETLIVVTADHETGGMSVGNNATGYAVYPGRLSGQRLSKDAFSDFCKGIAKSRRVFTWDDMREYLTENLGFWTSKTSVTQEQTEHLREMFEDMFTRHIARPDQKTLYSDFDAFTAAVFEVFDTQAGVNWASTKHTGSPVPVFAIGRGAEVFGNFGDNTDLPRKILKLAGKTLD
ncbi:MAG: alkaline phosphatase [Muribaculaceae bacterium]|nr:alkaline phosphatase [Muribaculaceae bacterium]MDE7141919.1 alkaline phosphatase [Muribaculaceae bacterium]